MNGDVLLDTSTVVAHWQSPLPELIASECELFLPLIALGELHAGARRARDRSKIERQIAMLLAAAVVLAPTESTTVLYGAIHAEFWPWPAGRSRRTTFGSLQWLGSMSCPW